MTNFDVFQSVTSIEKYSELMFDLLKDKKSPEEIQTFLGEELLADMPLELQRMAQNGYPLSLERLQK